MNTGESGEHSAENAPNDISCNEAAETVSSHRKPCNLLPHILQLLHLVVNLYAPAHIADHNPDPIKYLEPSVIKQNNKTLTSWATRSPPQSMPS